MNYRNVRRLLKLMRWVRGTGERSKMRWVDSATRLVRERSKWELQAVRADEIIATQEKRILELSTRVAELESPETKLAADIVRRLRGSEN